MLALKFTTPKLAIEAATGYGGTVTSYASGGVTYRIPSFIALGTQKFQVYNKPLVCDILMCAGYKAPARNGARGNVLEGNYEISWTGPMYLR